MKRCKSKTDSADFLGLPVDPSKLDNEASSSISRVTIPDQLSNLQILKDTAKRLIFSLTDSTFNYVSLDRFVAKYVEYSQYCVT
jgi:hypothetical protein